MLSDGMLTMRWVNRLVQARLSGVLIAARLGGVPQAPGSSGALLRAFTPRPSQEPGIAVFLRIACQRREKKKSLRGPYGLSGDRKDLPFHRFLGGMVSFFEQPLSF